jgi:putative DNA primase/helicase
VPNRIEADDLKRSTAVSDVVGKFLELKPEGDELVSPCPFHQESTASFKVNNKKGIWTCFGACQTHGDIFDFVQRREGIDFKASVDFVARLMGVTPGGEPVARPTAAAREAARQRVTADKDSDVVMPVPNEAPPVDFRHARHGMPSKTWAYRDAEGRLLGYVCRFDVVGEDGKPRKEICPRYYTSKGWRWTAPPKPRALYGLDELAKKPAAVVLVVEGEKACDAARVMFPQFAVVTWPGGASAVKHADWKPLDGRRVVIWRDNDDPGLKAARALAEVLG